MRLVILVAGGRLSEQAVHRLSHYLAGERDGRPGIAVIEAEADRGCPMCSHVPPVRLVAFDLDRGEVLADTEPGEDLLVLDGLGGTDLERAAVLRTVARLDSSPGRERLAELVEALAAEHTPRDRR